LLRKISREKTRATIWAILVTGLLALLILLGSSNLKHFDAALVGYTFATLFAVFGITRRYSLWLHRPPTAMYWRRGWRVFFGLLRPRHATGNLIRVLRHVIEHFALNRFIWRRGKMRWVAHWFTMWGCITACLVAFPLVFGWVHFDTAADHPGSYVVFVFGYPTISFPTNSLPAFLVFHALVWSSFLVIIGVGVALHRRLRDHGAAALQQFGEDILPLFLLFAISVSGLMLTASYTWMKGYAYDFLAILHAITVIFTLLWLPFGKFFHIFQRSVQIGVTFYKDVGKQSEQARCRRCQTEFASRMHVEDLITVERQLGYRYDMPDSPVEHYQWICPRCRRALIGLAQGRLCSHFAARGAESGIKSQGSGIRKVDKPLPRPAGALIGER